jgi:HKD family nuclease
MFGLGGSEKAIVLKKLEIIASRADAFSIAVSYIQQSGWELLQPLIQHASARTRVLCTDQLGITDPVAVKKMLDAGLNVRAFRGSQVYHPKVYLAHYDSGCDQFVLGSANLSRSALISGVEATITGNDSEKHLTSWFNEMFEDNSRSDEFNSERLTALEDAFAARLKSRLVYRRVVSLAKFPVKKSGDESATAAVESAFAGLSGELSTLNVDQAGNYIRSFSLLQKWLQAATFDGKALSDLRLLGFVTGNSLNALGFDAKNAESIEAVATIWVNWWANATEDELRQINPTGRLSRSRLAIRIFWSFPYEVTEYFLNNSRVTDRAPRKILQTIELLANAGRELPNLTLDEVKTLSEILSSTDELPNSAQNAIAEYLANKGTRGWGVDDRAILLRQWRPWA